MEREAGDSGEAEGEGAKRERGRRGTTTEFDNLGIAACRAGDGGGDGVSGMRGQPARSGARQGDI